MNEKIKKKFIGLIPARSDSKGIKKKNLIQVYGKPLILYTINSAKKSKFLNSIYVSSDDKKILDIANNNSISLIKRPKKISMDKTPMSKVIDHFIKKNNPLSKNSYIVLLQPTSPLRNEKHIDEAISIFLKFKRNVLVSVRESKEVIQKHFFLTKKNFLKTVFPENLSHKRRQDLKKTYTPNGAIYIFSISSFLKYKEIKLSQAVPYFMDQSASIDIDNDEDLEYLKFLGKNNGRI